MPDGYKPRILVVDDDPRLRESLGSLLMSVGYDVTMAENGVIALSHLNSNVPDIVVADVNMPDVSGIELMSHIRSQCPSMSVIAMSGDYQGNAVPPGIIADWFYPKGQHPHHLLSAIASLIAKNSERRSTDELRSRPAMDS